MYSSIKLRALVGKKEDAERKRGKEGRMDGWVGHLGLTIQKST